MWMNSRLTRREIAWELTLLSIVVVIGLTARLHEARYNFDGDEVFSVELASQDFDTVIIGSLLDRPHPPLHNILLHVWLKAFGSSELSARSLSILLSGAFLIISFLLLCRLVPRWLAMGVLLILALSPLFVYYGQQARPYALIAFLSSINLYIFILIMQNPVKRNLLIVWSASCCLLLYAQYLGTLLIAFQTLFVLFLSKSKRLPIIAYGFAGSVLILPWLIVAMGGAISYGMDPLHDISWMTPPTYTDLLWHYLSVFGAVPGLQARWLLVLLALLGIAYIRWIAASMHFPAIHLLIFIVTFGLPTVVFLLSVWGPKPIFASRQLLGAEIAFVVAIALCLTTFPRHFAVGFLIVLLVWIVASLPQVFPHNTKPPWGHVAEELSSQYPGMNIVAQERWVIRPLVYYRRGVSVRLSSELAEPEKRDKFLFVCRPFRCSDVESEEFTSRRTLVKSWQWGKVNAGADPQLLLYLVDSDSTFQN